jgi:hypothetical protein
MNSGQLWTIVEQYSPQSEACSLIFQPQHLYSYKVPDKYKNSGWRH